jgi:hypothetical protein
VTDLMRMEPVGTTTSPILPYTMAERCLEGNWHTTSVLPSLRRWSVLQQILMGCHGRPDADTCSSIRRCSTTWSISETPSLMNMSQQLIGSLAVNIPSVPGWCN